MFTPYMTLDAARKTSQRIINRAWKDLFAKAQENPKLYNKVVCLHKPELQWNKFGFTIAGRAWLEKNIIEMNVNYLYSKDVDKFLKSTTLHELAHIIAYKLGKEAGHGKIWKAIDQFIGDDGTRCHDYADPDNKPMRNRVTCICQCGSKHVVSIKKYHAFQAGEYVCTICKHNMSEAKLVANTKIAS